MIVRTLLLLFLSFSAVAKGQDFLNRSIALQVREMQVKDVLDQISENNGVYFTYAGNLEVMQKIISLNVEKVPLNSLLHALFNDEGIVFTCYANQIILKKKPAPVRSYRIRGVVLSSGTEQGVEFANLKMKAALRGAVSDFDGRFEFTAMPEDQGDSVVFFRIGFEPRTFSVKALSSLDFHKIYLAPVALPLDSVELSAPRAEIDNEGNRGPVMGSLYLDTHGQQVALFFKNKRKTSGRIKSLNFFLSGKGNTGAPFRVRVYGLNDSLLCPGTELLPEILIVRPVSGRGWLEVDVFRYNLRVPENGFFVAMEGVYPGDYKQQTPSLQPNNTEGGEVNDGFIDGSLDYGQRIGYNRLRKTIPGIIPFRTNGFNWIKNYLTL